MHELSGWLYILVSLSPSVFYCAAYLMYSLDLYLLHSGTQYSQYLVMKNPSIPPFILVPVDGFHQELSDNSITGPLKIVL